MEQQATRWHAQSLLGGGDLPPEQRGDCVRACITSILGLPLDAIENVHGEGWWDRLQAQVGRFGYSLAFIDMRWEPPPTYWVASLPSLNLDLEPSGERALHCVVAKGYELIHDPGIGESVYTAESWSAAWNGDEIEEGWVVVPLEPAKCAA